MIDAVLRKLKPLNYQSSVWNCHFLKFWLCYFFEVSNWNYCVRWNSTGDMLATASVNTTVQLIDFGSGKAVKAGITSDGCKLYVRWWYNCFIDDISCGHVSVLPLMKRLNVFGWPGFNIKNKIYSSGLYCSFRLALRELICKNFVGKDFKACLLWSMFKFEWSDFINGKLISACKPDEKLVIFWVLLQAKSWNPVLTFAFPQNYPKEDWGKMKSRKSFVVIRKEIFLVTWRIVNNALQYTTWSLDIEKLSPGNLQVFRRNQTRDLSTMINQSVEL